MYLFGVWDGDSSGHRHRIVMTSPTTMSPNPIRKFYAPRFVIHVR